jgi:hypothetical protein
MDLRYYGGSDRSGFQPSNTAVLLTWAFGPGWYGGAPLALRLVTAARISGFAGITMQMQRRLHRVMEAPFEKQILPLRGRMTNKG